MPDITAPTKSDYIPTNEIPPDKRTKSGAKVDIVKILNLRDSHGLSFAEIGRQLNFSRQHVRYAYNQFVSKFPDYQQTEIYKANKSTYLDQAEFMLLQDLLNEQKREKASLNNSGYVWDKIFNNNRTQQGLSTSGGVTVNIEIAYQEATDRSKALRLKHAGASSIVDQPSTHDKDDNT